MKTEILQNTTIPRSTKLNEENCLESDIFQGIFYDLEVELHQYYKTSKSCNFDIKNSPHISTSKPLQLLALTVFAEVCIAPALRDGAIDYFGGSIPIVFSKLAFGSGSEKGSML